MSTFQVYLEIGLRHILDPQGYDHIIFIVALTAVYTWKHFRKVLVMVTAFTLGHSITLALSTYDYILIHSDFIEMLIPVTIIITAIQNITISQKSGRNRESKFANNLRYIGAAFFGLIHGMGFSNYLKELLSHQSAILIELFAFNVGLEVGQIIVVVIILSLGSLLTQNKRDKLRYFSYFASGAAFGIASVILLDKLL